MSQLKLSSWARGAARWLVALLLGSLIAAGAWAAGNGGEPSIGEYRLGAGDILHITVYQNPDLTLDTRVSEAGTISFPLLGNVHVGGLTVTEAEHKLAAGLRSGNFIKQPQVTVLVSQVHGNEASVLGQVNRPGRFPLEVAGLRLTDLLAMAGGIAPTGADVVTVVGTREGRPYRMEVDLPTVFQANGRGADIPIVNGDVIWVDRAPMVYIYGEVQRPGALRLERNMTVMQVLAAGGGLTQRGTERGMRIHRLGPDGKMHEIEPKMDDEVRNGDVVYVRESIF
jgi:polysaccharide export outer membrane protein